MRKDDGDPKHGTSGVPDPIYWIANDALIAGLPLKQELYTSVATVACVYQEWRPQETQWESVRLGAMDQQRRLAGDEHRHMARTRPQEANALYGEIDKYPVHAALIEVSVMGNNPSWARLLALLAWPHVASTALGHQVTVPAPHHVKRLGQLLRDCTAGKISNEQLDQIWSAWSTLDQVPPRPPRIDSAIWNAIEAHVHAYRTTTVGGRFPDEAPRSLNTLYVWPYEAEIDPDRMADPDNEALSPEDADALSFTVSDAGEPDGDPLARIFRNMFEGERAFQHLPLAWNRLSPNEVKVLRTEFPSVAPDAQMGIALSICLSLPPEDLPNLHLHASLEQAINASADGLWHLAIVHGRSIVAVHGVQVPAHAYRRHEGMPGFLPSARACVLGLPTFVSKLLLAQSGGESGHLLRFFPEIPVTVRKAAEVLRQETGARLTAGRLQEVVANELFRIAQDECLVARAMPSSHILVGSGIYYSAYAAIRLYREHARAVESALGWLIPPPPPEVKSAFHHRHIGSELVIAPNALRAAIAALLARTENLVQLGRYAPERLCLAFNAICMYTLAILCLTTGHRSTNEPFPRPTDFCKDDVLLCDKRQFESNEQRVIPLSGIARTQLEVYLRSIAAVAGYLDCDAPGVAAQFRSLLSKGDGHPSCALFSILRFEDGAYTLRPFERADWKRLWPEWPWPENGNRHFLMQFLNAQRISRELASYVFGHAEPGQTPFNRQSGISPQQFFDAIRPSITKLENSLDLRVCAPLKAYRKTDSQAPPSLLATPLFGDASPMRNAKRPLTKDEKAFVRRLLQDFRGETFKVRTYVSRHCNGDPVLTQRLQKLVARCDRGTAA